MRAVRIISVISDISVTSVSKVINDNRVTSVIRIISVIWTIRAPSVVCWVY